LTLFLNVALFQAGWFACVLAAAQGLPWAGVAAAAAIVAWHALRARQPAQELKLIGLALLVGAFADSALAASGWIVFAPDAAAGLAPWWILAMWALFATTLNVSLAWLRSRLPLAALLGAVSGPLAYWAGARLGALELRQPAAALGALALVWAATLPGLLAAARRLDGAAR
jgi:Protein of unknown function (DUF2878)